MRYQSRSTLLGLAAALPLTAHCADAPTCDSKQLASFEFKISSTGAPLAPVSVNGRLVYLRLDTESALSSLRQGIAEKLHLPTETVAKNTLLMGNKDVPELARIADLAIGGMTRSDTFIQVQPAGLDASRSSPDEEVGILGMDLLSATDIEIDFPKLQASLYLPSTCPGGAAQWRSEYATLPMRRTPFGNFYVVARLNGKRLETAIATGMPVTQLTRDTAHRAYGLDTTSDTSRMMQLTAPPLKMAEEKVYFVDGPAGDCRLSFKDEAIGYVNCFGVYPLELGMSTLKSLHVYLATRQNVMFFADSAQPVGSKVFAAR